MNEQETDPTGEGHWDCPYCYRNVVPPYIDPMQHNTDCPFRTNWWTADDYLECAACTEDIEPDQTYRYIPMYRDPSPEEAEQLTFTAKLFQLVEVCGSCCILKVVKGHDER
jgi:hypothetical protein